MTAVQGPARSDPSRKAGGGARRRAKEEWVISEEAHLPIVSDAIYEAAQARFEKSGRSPASARAKREYLFSGMVRCCAGHQPLSIFGKARKDHRYYACGYTGNYGETAARDAHGGQKWVSVREDWILRLVLRFFEQRIFGMMRVEKLAKQLKAHGREQKRNGKLAGTKMRNQIAELDRKIKAQVQALEKGIEPELVSERIAELRGEKEALEEALSELGAEREDAEDEELAEQLDRLPDLSKALRDAPPELQRQVFKAFDLQIAYDKAEGRVEVSATVSESVASAFEKRERPPSGGLSGGSERHSGGPIRLSLPPTDRGATTPGSVTGVPLYLRSGSKDPNATCNLAASGRLYEEGPAVK